MFMLILLVQQLIVIGTSDFLNNIINYSNTTPNIRHDKRHSEETLILEWHKDDGIEFINYLYDNSSIYLDRKFKLYNFFKDGSRSVKEFTELSEGKIGETPNNLGQHRDNL